MSDETRAHRQLWTEALRSGEFKQGRRRLRDEDCFCCLGVACEVYRRTTGEGEWKIGGWFDCGDFDRDNKALPLAVQQWLGLNSGPGHMTDKSLPARYLTDLNDMKRWSFDQIAEVVDSEPEGLLA